MAKAESKTILKAYSTVESKLPTLPLEDGQLIFVYDKKKIILDNHGVRTVYEQIQTIETEEQRNDLLAPIDSFYFVIETSILWRYSNGHWNQITTSPQEQIDRIVAEGTKQVKAVQDKGTEVLQSIPEDFVTQMASKLDKQHGTENAGKIIAVNEEGNAIPLCPNGVRYNSETNNLEYGSDDLPLMEGIKLDDSLTKEGFAADAKVVGDIFDSKQNKLQGADIIVNAVSGSRQLIITDSSEREIQDLNIYGKTAQMSTRGVNLWSKESKITFTATKQVVFDTPIPAGDYVVSANVTSNDKDGTVCLMLFYYTDSGSKGANLTRAGRASAKITFTSNVKHVVLYAGQNANGSANDTATFADIQLEKGSTATAYEPYTGNKTSPSPEYEQKIENAGKLNADTQKYEVVVKAIGKNLFDIEKAKNTQNWFTSVQSGYSDFEIYVGKGNTVTISYTDTLEAGLGFYAGIVYKKDGAVSAWLYNSSNISTNTKNVTFTAIEDSVYIRCSTNDISKFTDSIKTLQVEIGKTQTNFIPGKEQSITITSDRPLTKFDKLVEQDGKIGWLYKSKIDTLPKTGYGIRGTDGNKYGVYFGKTGIFKDAITTSGSAEKDSNFFTHFKLGNPYSSNGDIAWLYVNKPGTTDLRVRFADESINTVELFEKYMADKDIKILYETAQTEFIPLPEEEQDAIRKLKTYYPTSVITADGGELDPDIKVTYMADTKNFILEQINSIKKSLVNTQIQLL